MTILQPVLRAFAQLDDRVLLRVVLASLAWALAGFVALVLVPVILTLKKGKRTYEDEI